MPWGRCDDKWWDHEKVLNLRASLLLPCGGLYWRAISWSNAKLADGRVSAAVVRLLGGNQRQADELVRVGLWEGSWETGYRVHDYLDFNKSKAQVLAERARWAEEKARQRGVSTTESTVESTTESTADIGPESPDVHHGVHGGVPTRAGGGRAAATRPAGSARRSRPVSPVSPGNPVESLRREYPSRANGHAPERADVAALLDRGWKRVTAAQRRVLDEVLDRHDVTGPEWAAAIIRATSPDDDPLAEVLRRDQEWQAGQRAQAERDEADWQRQKAADRESAGEAMAKVAEVFG